MSGLEVLLHVAGGVALLLWAARMVRTGIERAYRAPLRRFIARAARTRLGVAGAGLCAAAALQSTTATALLALSLVSSGLISTAPGLALLLGADVGATLFVQAASFGLDSLSPVLIVAGVALFLGSTERRTRQAGRIAIGLGLMLTSIGMIVEASDTLRGATTLAVLFHALESDPTLAVLVAALLTWLSHSSVAVVLLVMSLASAGVVPAPLALVLVLGANVGSGLIACALTWRQPARERRIPIGNLAFRVLGTVAALAAAGPLQEYAYLLGADGARRVANFHLVFNVALAVVFLPLVGPVGRLLDRLLPERTGPDPTRASPLGNPTQLDHDVIDRPRLALACATREVLHIGEWVELMLRRSLDLLRTDDRSAISEIALVDDRVDERTDGVKLYLTRVSRNELDEEEIRSCMEIVSFTIKLEHIGDIIEKNLLDLARKRLADDRRFSEAGWEELTEMHTHVVDNFRLALNVFVSGDPESARELVREKELLRALEQASAERHLQRLRDGTVTSIESSTIHLDVIRDLKQINSLLASVAYPILAESGQLLDSRLTSERAENSSAPAEPPLPDPMRRS